MVIIVGTVAIVLSIGALTVVRDPAKGRPSSQTAPLPGAISSDETFGDSNAARNGPMAKSTEGYSAGNIAAIPGYSPGLTYNPASTYAPAIIGISFSRRDRPYYDIYRATSLNGPWVKVFARLPTQAGSANDSSFPKGVRTLYYRVVAIDASGFRTKPSVPASITIP
jgi:hypothetical protein